MYNADKIDELIRLVNGLRYINLNEATIVKYINELKSLRNLSYEFRTNDFNDNFQNKLIEQGVPTLKSIYDKLFELCIKSEVGFSLNNYRVYMQKNDYINPVIGMFLYLGYPKSIAIEYTHRPYRLDYETDREKIIANKSAISYIKLISEMSNLLRGKTLEDKKGVTYKFGNTTPVYVSLRPENLDIIPIFFEINEELKIVIIKSEYFDDDVA